MKKSLSFIIILISLISCGNPIANYDNKKDNKLEIITEGIRLVNYGLKSSHVDVNDNNKLTDLWKEITSNKEVYSSSSLTPTSISGRFDVNGNYYENKWEDGRKPRSVLKNAMFINLKIKLIYPPYIGIIKQELECE